MGMQGDFLGSCHLLITRSPSKLKKETLSLVSVPAPFFSKPPNSRITVFYHVVESLEDQPDLVELARRLGDEGSEEKKPQNMTVRCCCLQVRAFQLWCRNSSSWEKAAMEHELDIRSYKH